MNIFATSECPTKCAEYLDNRRLVKMVLETAQIISTVIYKQDIKYHFINQLYKPTHMHHPCVIWAGKSEINLRWLFQHFQALCLEYTKRYNRVHKCYQFENIFKRYIGYCFITGPESFINCAANKKLGISYKNIKDTHLAYRLYLNKRKEAI